MNPYRETSTRPSCPHTGETTPLGWHGDKDERCDDCGAFRIDKGPWIDDPPNDPRPRS